VLIPDDRKQAAGNPACSVIDRQNASLAGLIKRNTGTCRDLAEGADNLPG